MLLDEVFYPSDLDQHALHFVGDVIVAPHRPVPCLNLQVLVHDEPATTAGILVAEGLLRREIVRSLLADASVGNIILADVHTAHDVTTLLVDADQYLAIIVNQPLAADAAQVVNEGIKSDEHCVRDLVVDFVPFSDSDDERKTRLARGAVTRTQQNRLKTSSPPFTNRRTRSHFDP